MTALEREPTPVEFRRLRVMYTNTKARCYNPNDLSYDNIGGKGIRFDDVWLTKDASMVFARWCVNHGWVLGGDLVMDRRDKTKNYGPDNCVFVTKAVKAKTRSDAIMVEDESGIKIPFKDFWEKHRLPHSVSYPIAAKRFTDGNFTALEACQKPPITNAENNKARAVKARATR